MSGAPARPLVMGVLNVTPDSFSDGGRYLEHEAALRRGLALVAQGAQIVDVGGESTRPGAVRVGTTEEIARVIPVIEGLAAEGIAVSLDTMNARTARAGVEAGARYINDVSAGAADPLMLAVAAEAARTHGATYIAGHWRALLDAEDSAARYADPAAEVAAELGSRAREILDAGVPASALILDPGLGFSKNSAHNWAVLAGLPSILALGYPVLIGASRKRFLGELLPESPVEDRDLPTAVLGALLADLGPWGLRVHEPAAQAAALDTWACLARARANAPKAL